MPREERSQLKLQGAPVSALTRPKVCCTEQDVDGKKSIGLLLTSRSRVIKGT